MSLRLPNGKVASRSFCVQQSSTDRGVVRSPRLLRILSIDDFDSNALHISRRSILVRAKPCLDSDGSSHVLAISATLSVNIRDPVRVRRDPQHMVVAVPYLLSFRRIVGRSVEWRTRLTVYVPTTVLDFNCTRSIQPALIHSIVFTMLPRSAQTAKVGR